MRKFNLNEIKIKSFITDESIENMDTIKGGSTDKCTNFPGCGNQTWDDCKSALRTNCADC